MKYLSVILLFFSLSFPNGSSAQCADSAACNSNSGIYSNDDAASIAYDNMGSGFHGTYIKTPNGGWKIWGEGLAADGIGDALSPTDFDATNYPGLTGTIYKMGIGDWTQLIVLTSTGLFSVGTGVVDTALAGNSFQKLTVDGKADGLPPGIGPDDVRMLFVTSKSIIITTCSGEVYVLSASENLRGNGGGGSSIIWSQVMENATTPLTNVIVTRGTIKNGFSLKSDGTLWTWGSKSLLGDGTNSTDRTYATQMVLPAGMPAVKMIQATHDATANSSYYILGTDKKLYGLGGSNYGQLGDNNFLIRTVWVTIVGPGIPLTDVAWISANEHHDAYPGLGVILTNGVLYTAGRNNSSMVGAASGGNGGYNALGIPNGMAYSLAITTHVEVGGHSTAVIRLGEPRYGYVGHRIRGSMGDGTNTNALLGSFNFEIPPFLAFCGILCPAPYVTANGPICPDGTAVFTITGNAGDMITYSTNFGPDQTVTIDAGGSFVITVNNAWTNQYVSLRHGESADGLCSNSLFSHAAVMLNGIYPAFPPVYQICAGDLLPPLPTVSTNNIPGTWSPPINNMETTDYIFTPLPGYCAHKVEKRIYVNGIYTPHFDPRSPICYGDTTFELPETSDDFFAGTWQPAFNNTQTATYTFTPESFYCARSVPLEIQVYDDFDFEIDKSCHNGNFNLTAVSNMATSFNWQNNHATISHDAAFDVTAYLNSTTEIEAMPITFDVTVTNSNGCEKTKSIELKNIYCDIQKGISPDGDGLNDFLDLRQLDISNLSIFNRYGMKVFSKNKYRDQWHGQTDDGTILPDGVYYYAIDFNSEPSKTGWIYINKQQ